MTGPTVAIYFESRLAKLGLKPESLPDIDAEVDELAEDEEEDQQARLKSRWAALEGIVGAEPRIQQVAADLVTHFEERSKAQSGKAMIVAMSRDISVHMYNAIIALRPGWHDDDPEKGVIKVVMTGFDAPCVHTMYVDKPMKGHNLMQAIARVNRVFRDKQGGLVVDYIGIASDLK